MQRAARREGLQLANAHDRDEPLRLRVAGALAAQRVSHAPGVRRADARDLARWMAMRLSLWPDADDTADALLAQLEEDDQLVLLAFDADGQAIGFAEATLRHDYVNGTESSPVGFLEGL